MIRLGLREIATWLECPPPPADLAIEHIATDSRKVRFGTLFAALPGSNVDGHDFAATAVSLGAVALLVTRRLDLDVPQLLVDDVLLALGRVASGLRNRLDPQVVGITGSNGKTTVKEMLAAILATQGEVLATQGNYNNELGLPLSLFALEQRHQYAVLEMGASKAGDIAYLAGIARPDVGLVTNVGPAHLKGFGSEEGVAAAKGEIYASLPAEGWAIFNADEPWLESWCALSTASHSISFGESEASDVRLLDCTVPRIHTGQDEFECRLQLPGRHNLINATAATAAALALNVDVASIERGLAQVKPVPGRLNLLHTASGWTVINDTYNANPASLYSALQVLSEMQGKGWLVLGDMKELGRNSSKMHREVGHAAKAMGVDRVFAVGELSAYTVDAFGEGAEHFESRDELQAALCASLKPGVNCLVKGSRSMGMEAVVEAISQQQSMREAS